MEEVTSMTIMNGNPYSEIAELELSMARGNAGEPGEKALTLTGNVKQSMVPFSESLNEKELERINTGDQRAFLENTTNRIWCQERHEELQQKQREELEQKILLENANILRRINEQLLSYKEPDLPTRSQLVENMTNVVKRMKESVELYDERALYLSQSNVKTHIVEDVQLLIEKHRQDMEKGQEEEARLVNQLKSLQERRQQNDEDAFNRMNHLLELYKSSSFM